MASTLLILKKKSKCSALFSLNLFSLIPNKSVLASQLNLETENP